MIGIIKLAEITFLDGTQEILTEEDYPCLEFDGSSFHNKKSMLIFKMDIVKKIKIIIK